MVVPRSATPEVEGLLHLRRSTPKIAEPASTYIFEVENFSNKKESEYNASARVGSERSTEVQRG